ncbi:hypothetical protein FB645_004740 [Coemansia sp. IMI 203386]|nr:hypothetical protein FB645_004740 [Coemansia sp. IMI 203386]
MFPDPPYMRNNTQQPDAGNPTSASAPPDAYLHDDDVTEYGNPWAAATNPVPQTARPWTRTVHRAVQRARAINDPLVSPSLTDINLFARKVARSAETGLLLNINDAMASPLPRAKTHMVGVKADSDIEVLDTEQGNTMGGSPLVVTEPEESERVSGFAGICGLAIRVTDDEVRRSATPNMAIPTQIGSDVVIMSRSFNEFAIEEAGCSPASSAVNGVSPLPRTIKMIRHRVSATDTLEGISVQYGVSVSLIKRLNRLWHPSEIAIRNHLYIPLRLCSQKYTVAYIEHVNRQHRSDGHNGSDSVSPFIDLIEVVLDSTPTESPPLYPLRKPRWPLVPYESIQRHFSFAL